jgi:predicted nucleic acid-binding Zn ribbon protein
MRRPAAVSDLLSALLRGTPAEKRLKEGEIWVVWDEAVGKMIAPHAQPSAFRDGKLTVVVDSAPWMQQLSFLKRELIANVNKELGSEMVKDLYFKAGKIETTAVKKKHIQKRRELTAEEKSWIEEQATQAGDDDLKAVFASLMKKDLESSD